MKILLSIFISVGIAFSGCHHHKKKKPKKGVLIYIPKKIEIPKPSIPSEEIKIDIPVPSKIKVPEIPEPRS